MSTPGWRTRSSRTVAAAEGTAEFLKRGRIVRLACSLLASSTPPVEDAKPCAGTSRRDPARRAGQEPCRLTSTRRTTERSVTDPLDVPLHDDALLAEVRLTTELIIAAS